MPLPVAGCSRPRQGDVHLLGAAPEILVAGRRRPRQDDGPGIYFDKDDDLVYIWPSYCDHDLLPPPCEKKQRIDKPASAHKLQKPAAFSSFKELLCSIALDGSSSKAATSSSSPQTVATHDIAVVVSPPSRSCLSLSPGSASLLVLRPPDWGLTFYVRVDLRGSFHTYPNLGGPFQSLQDVNGAIDRHLQDRWDPKMAAIDRYLQDRHDPKKCKEQNEDFLREMPVLLTLYRPDGTRKKCSKSEATERYRDKMLLLVQALVDKYNDDHNLLEDLAYQLKDLLYYQSICEARGTSSKKNRYYHLNFTAKPKRAGDFDCGMDNLFFVELMDGEHEEMLVNCFCMVKSNDNGHCYGCTNNGSVDMKHPNNADAYAGGHLNVRLPSGDGTDWPSYFDEDLDAEEARVRLIYKTARCH